MGQVAAQPREQAAPGFEEPSGRISDAFVPITQGSDWQTGPRGMCFAVAVLSNPIAAPVRAVDAMPCANVRVV